MDRLQLQQIRSGKGSNSGSENWTDYRVKAKIKRDGVADAYGYSLIYFRTTMQSVTLENSYVLAIRQTGTMELNKKTNGAWGDLSYSATISKDNDYHNVIITVVGSSIKVWFDKTEDQLPDLSIIDSTFSQGGIGLGTHEWGSEFDDVQVESLSASSPRWLDKQGTSCIANGQFHSVKSNVRNIIVLADNDSKNWNNYKIVTKIKRLGTVGDVQSYASVLFRMNTPDDTNYSSYVLAFRQDGTVDLSKMANNFASYTALVTKRNAISTDGDWHNVIISVIGSTVQVWFDQDESLPPVLSYSGLNDYAAGTVGVGSSIGVSGAFDDFKIENLMSVEPSPSHLYTDSNNTTILSVKSNVNLDNAQIMVSNSSNESWILDSLAGCAGKKSCSLNFPNDFPGANINAIGTYKAVVTNGNETSTTLLEVREKPLLSFVDVSDMHLNTNVSFQNSIDGVISDTNAQKYFPLPNFVVVTGDVTNDGTLSELTEIKNKLDLLSVPYYPIAGNHESYNFGEETGSEVGHNWTNVFGADKFSYDWTNNDFLFLAMDVELPYGGYGSQLNSAQHKAWLQNILDANPDKYTFLFSHYGLESVRNGGGGQGAYQGEPVSFEVRSILGSHGKVVAQFSGHSHLNGMSSSNGIYYFQTASLAYNNQYRYIEVYGDRIESHIIANNDIASNNTNYPGVTDSTHNADTYTYGLPEERQFKLNYATKDLDILDSIAVAGETDWRDYTYEAGVTLGKEDYFYENIAGLVFRYTDDNNYYSVLLDSAANTIKLQRKQNGVITDTKTSPAWSFVIPMTITIIRYS